MHCFSPKDSEYKIILDIQFQEVGAKRRLNETSKVNRHTDTHTYDTVWDWMQVWQTQRQKKVYNNLENIGGQA